MSTPSEERELILGNRQLLSFFFVVIALCGSFFAAGYIMGRNSGRASAGKETPAVSAVSADAHPSPLQPEIRNEPETRPAGAPPIETRPEEPRLEEKRSEERKAEEPKPTPARASRTEEPAPAASGRNVPVSTAEKGASYLQVTALPLSDAEAVVRTLKEQGFPTILTASSRAEFYRVLVGPYREAAQLSTTRDRLRALGFANTIVHKE